ncbi:MAG: HugZ family protein [Burkholderiales bacterium]
MSHNFEPIIHLLHNASWGSLATHSTQAPGYPFATMAPFALDEQHRPLFLISDLAEHTKNLVADARASLLVQPDGEGNMLARERLSIVGDVKRVTPSEALVARYLRYHPDAEQYLALAGFHFFQLVPMQARYIAGFGQMRWIGNAEWSGAEVMPPDEEALFISAIGEAHARGVRVLGIDRYGVDLEKNGKRERQRFTCAPVVATQIGDEVRRFLAT